MRVILATKHAITRRSFRSFLEAETSIEVVGEVSDGKEVVTITEKMLSDVIIIDMALPQLNGLADISYIKNNFPAVKIIILTICKEDNFVCDALRSGVDGCLAKSTALEELPLALKIINKGGIYLSPFVSQKIIRNYLLSLADFSESAFDAVQKATQQEKHILHLLAKGKSRTEMAVILAISPKTVDRHLENLKTKLKLPHKAALVRFAVLADLVEGGYRVD